MNPLLSRYLETVIHCDFLPLWRCGQRMCIRHLNNSPADHLIDWTRDMARVYGKAARPQHWSGTVDSTLRSLMRPSRILRPSEYEFGAHHALSEAGASTEQPTNALSCCAHTHALRPIFLVAMIGLAEVCTCPRLCR